MPTERPPASAHPPAAASITPPMPPQTSTAPASAIRRPTSWPSASSAGVPADGPMTAMYGSLLTSVTLPPRSAEHRRQQRDRSGLVQRLVAVAALGRLHTRPAPLRAPTPPHPL